MARRGPGARPFAVLLATDGSPPARAAAATAASLCWPEDTRLHAVAVREIAFDLGGPARDELDALAREATESALRVLSRRGAPVSTSLAEGPVGPAILAEARRQRARVIVVGSRGHSALRRLALGSTSRFLVREAPCPVLVVRDRPARGRRVVLGVDGSAQARHAAAFLGRLAPARGARVQVVSVVEPMRMPSLGQLPASVRQTLQASARELVDEQRRKARRAVDAACRRLEAAGWGARGHVSEGTPLDVLLARVAAERADLLAVGARGVGGMRRWLLGSVAEGALSHAPCAVLVVR